MLRSSIHVSGKNVWLLSVAVSRSQLEVLVCITLYSYQSKRARPGGQTRGQTRVQEYRSRGVISISIFSSLLTWSSLKAVLASSAPSLVVSLSVLVWGMSAVEVVKLVSTTRSFLSPPGTVWTDMLWLLDIFIMKGLRVRPEQNSVNYRIKF